jgi:hypothetical protein
MRYLAMALGTTLAAAVLYFSAALGLAPAPIAAEYWVRETIVVKRELARGLRGQPKILVASGSSGLFGVDARLLAERLKRPALNYGLAANLPLARLLGEVEAAAEPGDVVVLQLEPNYYRGAGMTYWQARNMIAWEPAAWRALPLRLKIQGIALAGPELLGELAEARLRARYRPASLQQRLDALDDRKVLARRAGPPPTTFAYSADNVDEVGNMRNTAGARYRGGPLWSPEDETPVDPEVWELLSAFVARQSRREVAVCFANIPYVRTPGLDEDKIRSASRRLSGRLARLAPVLDERERLVFDRGLFFNTDTHLNPEGRRLRTELLAAALWDAIPLLRAGAGR